MQIMDGIYTLANNDISYLENILLDENGELKILSYEQLKNIPQSDISIFCVRHGFYQIPTTELIEFLITEIDGKTNKTIEVGSGNGVLAKELGIVATDNYQQTMKKYREIYELSGQAIVKYGKNVEKFSAKEATKKFKPHNVIACWVTHKYNPLEHWRGGNEIGVDEVDLLRRIKKYIFIGNENTHKQKKILDIPHRTIKADWLVSRSITKEQNMIWIWG